MSIWPYDAGNSDLATTLGDSCIEKLAKRRQLAERKGHFRLRHCLRWKA